MEAQASKRKLLTVRQWYETHGWPTMGALHWRINKASKDPSNSFRNCYVRVGRRILIDEDKFFEWVDEQNKDIPRFGTNE